MSLCHNTETAHYCDDKKHENRGILLKSPAKNWCLNVFYIAESMDQTEDMSRAMDRRKKTTVFHETSPAKSAQYPAMEDPILSNIYCDRELR